jgi:hypothetical protein
VSDPEYDPARPLPTNSLLRPRRIFVASITLVFVFGITASLLAIGLSRLRQIEPKPSVQQEAPTPPSEPDRPSVESIEPPKVSESLFLDATLSYLASTKANAQTATDDERLQLCLFIEDGTKDRLNCYDGIFAPDPKPKPPVAKLIADCKLFKEEDERLACFNRFMAPSKPPNAAQKATPKAHASK